MIKDNFSINRVKPAFCGDFFAARPFEIRGILINHKVVEVSNPSYSRFTIDEARIGTKIGTKGLIECNAASIYGKNCSNNFVMHLCPDRESFFGNLPDNLIKLCKNFKNAVNLLKNENIKPEGLIYGARYKGGRLIDQNKQSRHLTVILKHLMEKSGIVPTVMAGAQYEKSIFYNGQDTWYFGANCCQGGEKEYLMDAFEYVRIAPTDRIKFSDSDWIEGKEGSLSKGNLEISFSEVLEKHGLDIEKTLKMIDKHI